MAIHSLGPLVPALVSPVTLMFMNYIHREITSLVHVAFNFGKSGYIFSRQCNIFDMTGHVLPSQTKLGESKPMPVMGSSLRHLAIHYPSPALQ